MNNHPNYKAILDGVPRLKKIRMGSGENGISFAGCQLSNDWKIDNEIPYLKAVYSFMGERLISHDHVIILSDEPSIARNAAAVLATKKYDTESDLEDDPFYDDDFEDDEEYFDTEEMLEMGLEDDLDLNPRKAFRELDLAKPFESMTIIGNPYHILLQTSLYPARNLLVTGLEVPDGREEKLEAISAVMDATVSRTMLLVPKSERDSIWIKDLIREYHFSILELPDCSDYLKSLWEKPDVNIDREFAVRSYEQARIDNGNNLNEEMVASYATNPLLRYEEKQPALEKLKGMIGLEDAKETAMELVAMMYEKEINPDLGTLYKSMIFIGNPGTGKTTVAETMTSILAETGNARRAFVTVSRSDLIGKYVGHTAPKVERKFHEARGGVLFVDEAGFFLGHGGDGGADRFANEAIKEFVRYMEQFNDVTVIFAMYKDEVEDFLNLDEGLSSRISRHVIFEDYTDDELVEIFHYMSEKKGYQLADQSDGLIRAYMQRLRDREKNNFGNAREVRKLIETTVKKHALRNYKSMINSGKPISKKTKAAVNALSVEDLKEAIKTLEKSTDKPRREIGFVAPSTCVEEG